jgi:MYXO-CTERM domain-containing protein
MDTECAAKDNALKPICDLLSKSGTGACVECLEDAHCLNPQEPYCNPAIKECTRNCTNDAMCSDEEWCDNPTAQAFAGDCLPDLPNGEPIPTSAMHMPPLEGVCTPDAAQVVCASRVCDEADNLCGYGVGTGPCSPASAEIICRSGVCDASGACGCTTDSQCGDATSGKVCDIVTEATMNQCLDGCRGPAKDGSIVGNGCPPDLVCTSLDETIGQCKPPVHVDGPKVTGGYVEGAGLIQCGAAGAGGAGPIAGLGMLAALAGHLVRRRRRQ